MERCAVQQKCCSQQQQSKSICQWHWQRTILGWQYENSNKALAYSVEWIPLQSKAEGSKESASTLHTHAECMNRCRLVFFFLILQKPTHKTRLKIWEFMFRRSVLTPESHKSSNWQDRISNGKILPSSLESPASFFLFLFKLRMHSYAFSKAGRLRVMSQPMGRISKQHYLE